MCWSEPASLAMAGLGAAAAVVTARRGDTPAIPVTLAFFAAMEALQFWGYQAIDQCGLPGNRWATILSWVHIALQPTFINAFALAVVAPALAPARRRLVLALAGLASALLLLRLAPFGWAGACLPGTHLCGPDWCTRSGTWHLAWDMPLNDLAGALTGGVLTRWGAYPDYMLAVFVLPLAYGGWRFVLMHASLGPVLATLLTDDPGEMPAIWCLFSVGLVLLALSPWLRARVGPTPARPAG
ncbi:DUF5765 domain-containing protein [Roseicyclus persicicus]|uniref:Uncharacterized protein n=1 Tax=Roseicyclus persicicus TaxID=2650661 RepID=A0A7X6K037_9RHOB|nr:DUF5765 domain-containing protein [Roseibacterium persicicum]NKX46229.1 hypothetical protein [Roseibacterium persicicum]